MGTLLTYTNICIIHIPSLLCCEEHNIHWLSLSRQKTHSSALHYTAKISFHLGFCLQPNRLSKRKAQVLSFHFDLQDCIIYSYSIQTASFIQLGQKSERRILDYYCRQRVSHIHTRHIGGWMKGGSNSIQQVVSSKLLPTTCNIQSETEGSFLFVFKRGTLAIFIQFLRQ